jgi:hypothetical protein
VSYSDRLFNSATFAALMTANNAFAVDKVYHPYVEPKERELEYRVTDFDNGKDGADFQVHRLGVGYGASDRIAVEAYVIGNRLSDESLKLEAYELELRWQLYEQGANWLDSALQFELEHTEDGDYSEVSMGYIAEKEIAARWSATANVMAHFEFGDRPLDRSEGEVATQIRYRLNQQFEPAMEAYWDEKVVAVGPAAIGILRVDGRQRLKWEAAVLFTANHDIAHRIFRGSLEWEF